MDTFDDIGSISAGSRAHFAVALMENLVSGYPDNTIQAQAPLTRAEFAALLSRGTEHGYHDNYEAKIQTVTVYPVSPIEIEIGESITLTARAAYTDGTSMEYNVIEPYSLTAGDIITIDGNKITGNAEGIAVINFNNKYLLDDSITVKVKIPVNGPKILVTDYPSETELSSVTISGSVSESDLEGLRFICDGKDVKFNEDGTFSTNVTLHQRQNNIKFAAVDKYGVMTEKNITIIKICEPSIRITDYRKNIADKKVTVSGIITDIDVKTVEFSANGTLIKLEDDGSFIADLDLNVMGPNEIVFHAKNKYNRSSEETITVVRYEFYKEK